MTAIIATMWKELLQLWRDKAGLVVLFLMPSALVLIISLVQDNVINTTGVEGVKAVFIDNDGNDVGRQIRTWLKDKGNFELITEINGKPASPESAREAVRNGDYQFCVIVPQGCTDALRKRAKALAANSMVDDNKPKRPTEGIASNITVFFDPTIQGSFRTAVIRSVEYMIFAIEIEERADAFAKTSSTQMKDVMRKKIIKEVGDDIEKDELEKMVGDIPSIKPNFSEDPVIGIDKTTLPAPTATQQNVPAWTIFGMFFIVVPLGGSILRERQEGAMQRLLTMPVSYVNLLIGKILAYVLVCLVQFVLMILVGILILPRFGMPVLTLGSSPVGIVLMALASAFAATGYGVLIGTVCKSYEQASMFGPVSVVIAAAMGGIMVPVYIMPKLMKTISVYSPLAWGLNGFLDIFVREGTVATVMPWIACLMAFFAACLAGAWFAFQRQVAR